MTFCSLCHSTSLRRPCARAEPACATCCRRNGGCVHHRLSQRHSDRLVRHDHAGREEPQEQLEPQQPQVQLRQEEPQQHQQHQQQQQQQQPDLSAVLRGLQESIAEMQRSLLQSQQGLMGAINTALRPAGARQPDGSVPPPPVPANEAVLGSAPAQLPPSSHLDSFPEPASIVSSAVSSAAAALRSSDQVSHTSHNSSGAVANHISFHLSGGATADAAWLASAPVGISPLSPLKATKAPASATQLSASLRAWLAAGKLSPDQHRPWDEYIRQTVEYAHVTSAELALKYHHAAMGRFKAVPRTYDPVVNGPVDHVAYLCHLHSAVTAGGERPAKRSRQYPLKSIRGVSPPPTLTKRRGAAKGSGDPDSGSDTGRGQRHFCEHHQRLVFHTSEECSVKNKKVKHAKSEGSG